MRDPELEGAIQAAEALRAKIAAGSAAVSPDNHS